MTEALPDSAQRRVGDIMTTNVVTIQPETKVNRIAWLMAKHDIGGIPVIDDNEQVVGIVTELDMIVRNTHFKMPHFIVILDSIIYFETPRHFRERLKHVLGVTANDIMSEPVYTISPDASIADLADLIVERRINPIPVVSNEQLVGIVSRSDIIHLIADMADEDEI